MIGVSRGGAGQSTPAAMSRPDGRMVPKSELLQFARQISVMLEAGVSITEALEAFVRQSPGMRVTQEIDGVRQEISEGENLSTSFARRSRTFPPVFSGLMRAAEAVGDLSGMFTRLADWVGREQRIMRQVRSALAYPAVLTVVGGAITMFLVTMVLPRFEAIYAQRSAELPPLTSFVLSVGRAFSQEWIYWFPVLSGIVMMIMLFRRSEPVMDLRERIRFGLPVVRSVAAPAETARAFRTLSVLLGAGVPLLDAVSICRELTGWKRWRRLWDEVEDAAREGRGIVDALQAAPMIPPATQAMIAAGERGGRLPETLARIADAAEEDLEIAVKRTSTLLEPLAIVVLGTVVGLVAVALLLPIFKMGSTVS